MKMNSLKIMYMFLILFIFIIGCAAKRPVLYPNQQMKQAGEVKVKEEIDACIQLAQASGAKGDKGEEIGKRAAGAAVVGAASGAAWGAFFGDAGRHAGAGGAAAVAGTLAHGMMTSGEPDVIFRGFVERCLREKGYDVIGWR
jgi:outer membrane lipoprotein SlyB